LGVLVWLVMRRTQIGVVARAVIMNEELAQSLGINTRLVRFVCLGFGRSRSDLLRSAKARGSNGFFNSVRAC
jgi:branched-chain amino acid transport system permease protein